MYPLDLLLDALSTDDTCFIVGAGASSPHVPTMAQLPGALASYAPRLSSFAATSFADSPLRLLIAPMIEAAKTTSSLDEWKAASMTPATIGVLLEHLITKAHWVPLPQYDVFHLIPSGCSIISFNWDGLAVARCPQHLILHPHGIVTPRLLTSPQLDDVLDFTQLYDSLDGRELFVPGIVLPGEEETPRLARMRERVLKTWLSTKQVVVIGYGFGVTSPLAYDRVWLDIFSEALRVNREAPVHILSPDAEWLRGELTERLKRSVNVHAWPLKWHAFARFVLELSRQRNYMRMIELRSDGSALRILERAIAEASAAA